MDHYPVKRFMTRTPHTIGHDQPLTAAHQLMRQHDIRHLPVLDGGRLAGVLSQRDLYLIESLKDVDPERVSVSEAMSTEVFTVTPNTTLQTIVSEMAVHKYGSAVVMDANKVVGVFTTTDALGAFAGLLAPALEIRPRNAQTPHGVGMQAVATPKLAPLPTRAARKTRAKRA
jgi:acetoin utilization protein AcuB